MRLGFLMPLLALSPAVQAAAVTSQESRDLLARDFDLLASRDLGSLSPREAEFLTRALVERGLLDDVWQKVKGATTCAGGEVGLNKTRRLVFSRRPLSLADLFPSFPIAQTGAFGGSQGVGLFWRQCFCQGDSGHLQACQGL